MCKTEWETDQPGFKATLHISGLTDSLSGAESDERIPLSCPYSKSEATASSLLA